MNLINKFKSKKSIIGAMAVVLFLSGCKESSENKAENAVYLSFYQATPLKFELKTQLPGRVIASEVAEIRPQVGGIILKREFVEGTDVKEGQSLYQIDPVIYQAQVDSAEANVKSAEASANIAHLTLKRYQGLLRSKSVSQQEYDQVVAEAKQADAALLVAQAELNKAQVNLNYTKVYAPISGYIGKSNVTEGALVSVGQSTPMAVIRKTNPIFVDMTQAATTYQKYQKDANTIYTPVNKVNLYFNDGTPYEYTGEVKFLDKAVNETTGTVTIRSEFNNPEGQILPGMFVRPEMVFGVIDNALVVPQGGITIGTDLTYTAIIATPKEPITEENKDNMTYQLEQRNNIQVYKAITGYWVVTSGINPGELVVLNSSITLQGKNIKDENLIVKSGGPIKTLTQKELDSLSNTNY